MKGSVTPVTLRTGGNLTVKASSDSDTQSVTALILGKTYTLKKQADGTWTIPYTVSSGNGKYNVLLKAVDALGNTGSTTLTFTVNNPVVNPNHGTASTSTLPASSSTKTSLFPVSGSTIKSSSSSGTHGHTTGVSTVKGGSQSTVAGKVVFPVFGGGLSAISSSSSGLLDGFLSYAGNSLACNVKGSVYGGSAAFLENPFNPFFYQFYTWDKLIQAGQKAWTTGNVWDFFNYDFFHIYGYSNLDHTWGGENIKQIIKFFTGVDEDGDLSVGNFLLLLVSVIPIGRLGTLAGKLLTKSPILLKYWRFVEKPVTYFLSKLGIFTKDPVEAFLGVSSKLSSLLDPSLGLIPACLELVAGISGKEVLRKIIESSVYKRLFGYDTVKSVTTIFNPNSWNPNNIKKAWNETIESVVSNAKWLGSTVKDIGKKLIVEGKKLIPNAVKVATKKVVNKVKNTVNTVKKIVKNTAKTVKNTAVKIVKTAKKAVKTVKKVVKKTVKTVKKAAKKVVRTVKKVVKKTVRVVKKVAKKVVKTVKNTVKKAVNAVKNVGKTVGKILKWW